jgi:hypothetical protein
MVVWPETHWNGRKRCLSEVRAGEDDPHDSKMGWNMMNGKHGAATLWMVATRKNTSAASCSHVPWTMNLKLIVFSETDICTLFSNHLGNQKISEKIVNFNYYWHAVKYSAQTELISMVYKNQEQCSKNFTKSEKLNYI